MSWKMLKEAHFENEAYENCDRLGTWEAVVDAVAYARGSRVGASGKGKRAGLHLYVRTQDSRKFWLFVFFFPASEIYEQARSLVAGDRIRLEMAQGQKDHSAIELLEKLK